MKRLSDSPPAGIPPASMSYDACKCAASNKPKSETMKTRSCDAKRRDFIKLVMGGGASLFFPWKGGSGRALAAIPGRTLLPADISKFMAPMLIPPVMPKAGTIKRPGGVNIDSYEISVKEFSQQILPPGFPPT
jgi:hypothetical protein